MNLPSSVDKVAANGDAANGGVDIADALSESTKSLQTYLSYQSLIDAVAKHESDTKMKYNKNNKIKGFENDVDVLENYLSYVNTERDLTLHWELGQNKEQFRIPFTGVPFASLSRRVYSCQHGKNYDMKNNAKKRARRIEEAATKQYSGFKPRNTYQPSKKTGCPAQFNVKKLLYFPSYSVSATATKWEREVMMKSLRKDLLLMKNSHCKTKTSAQETDFNISPVVSTANSTPLLSIYPAKTPASIGQDTDASISGADPLKVPAETAKTAAINNVIVMIHIDSVLNYVTKFPAVSDHQFHPHAAVVEIIEPLNAEPLKDPICQKAAVKSTLLSALKELTDTVQVIDDVEVLSSIHVSIEELRAKAICFVCSQHGNGEFDESRKGTQTTSSDVGDATLAYPNDLWTNSAALPQYTERPQESIPECQARPDQNQQKVHAGFRCGLCKEVFETKRLVVEHHNKIHTEQFACDTCGKCFGSAYKLNKHKIVHNETKMFQCKECGKLLTRLSTLRRHHKRKHNSVPWRC